MNSHSYVGGSPVPIGTAARMLGVTVETIRRWNREGLINATRTPGGQRRFSIEEIERVKSESTGGQS